MPLKVAISIINYRTGRMTIACVQSVLDDLGDIDGRVIVVDNASGDGSADEIAAWMATHPMRDRMELVRSPVNSGFSGGHNQGMAAAEADYYLILNSDALLRPGFFRDILATADARPDAGLIAPRLEGEDGVVQDSVFRFPGPASELIRGANTGFVTKALISRNVPLGHDPDPAEADWASFACILARGAMVRAIGPMDEGYFLYFEDAEYCLRARRAGWGLALARDAVAVHFRGGSGPVKSLARQRKRLPTYYYQSRSRFLCQAHGRAGLLAANLLWIAGRTFAQFRRLAGKPVTPPIERELADIWISAFAPLAPGPSAGGRG